MLGCGSGNSDLMPLQVGHTWNYIVKAGFDTYVVPVTVRRRLSVASGSGVELAGPLGVSRLAWKGNALFADRLVATQFSPAIPILFDGDDTHEHRWKGRVDYADRGSSAAATQSQTEDNDLTFGGRKIECVRSTVTLKTATREIELTTWFSRGLGIVQQEQRTDKTLLVRLTLLDEKP